jgi:predicted nucleotide-binding protein
MTEIMSSGAGGGQTGPDPRVVFVVHGRNMTARTAMFQFLRAIGLRPREWSQAVADTGKAMPYIGEVLDAAFSKAQAVVVLMTPDDEARLREQYRGPGDPPHETELTPQARPNVIFEAGMAMGRAPDRTVIVEVGEVRPFSDVGGRHVIRMNNSSERRQELAQRLRDAGCDVDLGGTDWHREGDFDADAPSRSITAAAATIAPTHQAARGAAGRAAAPAAEGASLVLMLPPGEDPLFVEAMRIESGETVRMSLRPADGRQAAVIDGLARATQRDPLPVAFGTKAFYGRVSSVKHVVEPGGEVWNVDVVPDEGRPEWDYNMSGYSSEQVAEMRARRILLDEKLPDGGGRYRRPGDFNAMMLEETVARGGRTFKVPRSPFPTLYASLKEDEGLFLSAARLFAVLELLLTGTVERIHKLELDIQEGDRLAVNFEGQRKSEYSNQPPQVLKVEGVCDLTPG